MMEKIPPEPGVLITDESGGTANLEYLTLLALVGVASIGAVTAMGPALLRLYRFVQFVLLSPIA